MSPIALIRQSPKQHGWAWYLVPLNACGNGFGLFVPLYLLQLGGSVVEVALAAFLTGLASTVGSFAWGKLIDTLNWRATAVIISALSSLIISVVTYIANDIPSVIILWTLVGFLTAGGGPATNLMIMQRSKRENWSDTFSWTSLISNVGIVIGMIAGFLWLAFSNDIHSYAIACGAIAASAAITAWPLFRQERQELGQQISDKNLKTFRQLIHDSLRGSPSAYSKIKKQAFAMVLGFLKDVIAKRESGQKLFATPNVKSKKQLLFFAGVGVFFLSGNLFYTPYTPYLKANGMTDSQVFLAYTVLTISKVMFLPFNSRIVQAAGGDHRMTRLSYIPRTAGTAVAIAAALFAVGNPNAIFLLTLVAFVSVDIAFSMWSTTTTSSLMQMVPSGKAGKIFGVNQAVTGLGLIVGSIVGGEIAATFGYPATFSLAIAALLISLALIAASFKKDVKRVEAHIKA